MQIVFDPPMSWTENLARVESLHVTSAWMHGVDVVISHADGATLSLYPLMRPVRRRRGKQQGR